MGKNDYNLPSNTSEYLDKTKSIDLNTVILSAQENELELGYIAFNLENTKASIVYISLCESTKNEGLKNTQLIVDSLIKATVSYIINRNIFYLESHKYFEVLENLNFKNSDNKVFLDLSKALLRCK